MGHTLSLCLPFGARAISQEIAELLNFNPKDALIWLFMVTSEFGLARRKCRDALCRLSSESPLGNDVALYKIRDFSRLKVQVGADHVCPFAVCCVFLWWQVSWKVLSVLENMRNEDYISLFISCSGIAQRSWASSVTVQRNASFGASEVYYLLTLNGNASSNVKISCLFYKGEHDGYFTAIIFPFSVYL